MRRVRSTVPAMRTAHDADIRPALRRHLQSVHPGARVLDEVGLHHGQVRVDVAVLTVDALHGYEVKAEADTLQRLPTQTWRYSEVMDACTLVVTSSHLEEAAALVPTWWGLLAAEPEGFRPVRPAGVNPGPDAHNTARLLWRDEVLALLEQLGAVRGYRAASKNRLYRRLLEVVSPEEARAHVRRIVCARGDWRKEAPLTPDIAGDGAPLTSLPRGGAS